MGMSGYEGIGYCKGTRVVRVQVCSGLRGTRVLRSARVFKVLMSVRVFRVREYFGVRGY